MTDASEPTKDVDIFDPEFMKERNLTKEQQEKIEALQKEIDEMWNKKGNYTIDDDAWKTMPLFMDDVAEKDVEQNPDCAALADIKYEVRSPIERVQEIKEQANKLLIRSLNPEQTNFKNFARSAVRFYTEGLGHKCDDRMLNAQMFANRSMAHYVLENYGHGLEDAQKAIMLEKEYTKAYYRGAKCAERIRKFDVARQLIDYGLRTNPAPTGAALEEFTALTKAVEVGEEVAKNRQKKERIQQRSAAADSSAIARKLTSAGIAVGRHTEVTSEQWAQLKYSKPYFDETGVLHVPILILYDEYSQSDFMQDVAGDVPLGDVIDDMLPVPWDEKGQYQTVSNLVTFFKVDDGVAMPKYYKVDTDWHVFEILRMSTYVMPCLVPTFHVVPKGSPFLETIKFE